MSEWTSTSGAKRSQKMRRYDLIPLPLLKCIADRLELGAEKYGEWNWKKSIEPVIDHEYVKDGLNHMQQHLSSLMAGDFDEDDEWGHLGGIIFGCMMRACALDAQGDYTELYKPVPMGFGEVITPFTSDKNDDDVPF